jgi:hypothetical protein
MQNAETMNGSLRIETAVLLWSVQDNGLGRLLAHLLPLPDNIEEENIQRKKNRVRPSSLKREGCLGRKIQGPSCPAPLCDG